MAKVIPDATFNAILAKVATANLMLVCDGEPADRAAAIAAARVTVSMVPGLGGGDYTELNGDVSGRKVQMTAKNNQTIDSNGNVDHVVLVDATSIILITTTPAQTLATPGQANIAAWDAEFRDPI